MKRFHCSILAFYLYAESIYAQSYYMNEIAEDAGYRNDSISFLSIIGFIIVVLLLILFVSLFISIKIDDYKFDKKYKNRNHILTEEAKRILSLGLQNTVYFEYYQ